MARWRVAIVLLVSATNAALAVQGGASRAGSRSSRVVTCALDLGSGTRTGERFCDVVIASTGADSVAMPIPPHQGPATLRFNLHSRVQVRAGVTDPIQAFVRSSAVVAVVRPTGEVIERAAVIAEYRGPADLFDRIAGTGPDGFKVVAPGPPEPVRIRIPAGVTAIGIVGVRVELVTTQVRWTFDAPGRPVALVSGMRVEW